MMKCDERPVSVSQIKQLRDRSRRSGDHRTAEMANAALRGNWSAMAACSAKITRPAKG